MYRKYTSSQIFNGNHFLPEGQVIIMDTAGKILDILDESDAGDDIQHINGILSPGLINCHCHLELSHLKGKIPEKTGLIEFITQVMSSRTGTQEEIMTAIERAETEMIENGIVAVGDICNTSHTIETKKRQQLYYHNFLEVSGVPPELAEFRFGKILELYEAFAGSLAHNSIVPHAPYSVSTALLKKIIAFEGNHLLTIHNQETPEENELFRFKTGGLLDFFKKFNIDASALEASGTSSLSNVVTHFKPAQPLILVHNVHTNESDIEQAQALFKEHPSNLFFCLCPNANQYISGTLPDLQRFRQSSLNLVLGTDSLASNHQLSIWEEIRTMQQQFPDISLEEMLRWSTINGARALGIEQQFGSFEKGKQPGMVCIDAQGLGVCRVV